MRHGRQRTATMAEIAEAAHLEESKKAAATSRRRRREQPSDDNPYVITIDRRTYYVVDESDLSPGQAQALATSSRLVIWDACGCGGGCGYETWSGAQVKDLTEAGPPSIEEGALLEVRDVHGVSSGVLVVHDVRWGRLH